MKKYILVIGLIFSIISGASAQKYRSTQTGSGWYAGVNASVNLFVSEGIGTYLPKITNAVGSNVGGVLGYDFNPVWSGRAVFSYQSFNWPDIRLVNNVTSFSSPQLIFDAVLNLNNALKFDFMNGNSDILLYAGAGGFYRPVSVFTTPATSWLLQGGAQLNFHLDTQWDISLAGEMNASDDILNGQADGFPVDLYPVAKIGFIYHFSGGSNKNCRCFY